MKLSDLLSNISGLAALAIVVAGVGGFFIVIGAAAFGTTLTPEALALADRVINVLIGLAIGAGSTGSALALRSIRAMEMQSMSHRKDQ
jgi:sorbitol-specific phosphotransferase system component IIBC